VERVADQFDEVNNLSWALTNTTVPLPIGEDLCEENGGKYGFE